MRIAFYAPMKSPNHPVPSGDREMARLLMKALRSSGHAVELASELRSFSREPDDAHYDRVAADAAANAERLVSAWASTPPDLWFTYHPYYKAPDLLGPRMARQLTIPYVTAEASYSARRNIGRWAQTQASVADAVSLAASNICFTERDRRGLDEAMLGAQLDMLPPFIDTDANIFMHPRPASRLITVAMMRPGDKMDSYRMLARALGRLLDLPWHLSIVGDGPCREAVKSEFAAVPAERIKWLGELTRSEVVAALSNASTYLWPGFGEAFGLAYLEAQMCGLPVVAQNIAGAPEVVKDGKTGFLTPPDDIDAYADAIRRLLLDDPLRERMGKAAQDFVSRERSLPAAAAKLDQILRKALS